MSEYCLRWNNHRPNLVTVFSELLTSEALVDVTLATDGHYIHAHKLVLSACSVYFKDLFGANPCKHPIVILKDIRIDDLKTVIDFIYRGEVNVAQDRLQDVLRTAESLRIKGLAENPRGYDDVAGHGTRFLGARETTRQKSSLTDSREQSLSLEGEEEGGEPATPPQTKRRKITPSHDSSESVQEEEADERASTGGRDVKDEPLDEDPERPSRDSSDHDTTSMGGSQDGGTGGGDDAPPTTTSTTPGTSADQALGPHSQGGAGRSKRGVLQRQQVIIREGGGGGVSGATLEEKGAIVEIKSEGGMGVGVGSSVAELIVPDTVVVTGGTVTLSSAPSPGTLLQVPVPVPGTTATLVVAGGREAGLAKQHSHPSSLLHPHSSQPPPMAKQLSHPEARGPPTHAGPPTIARQRSHPSVLAHSTPPPTLERLAPAATSQGAAPPAGQHLQVIPYSVLLKQRTAPGGSAPPAASLRPIQPKPQSTAAEAVEAPPKKEGVGVPLIRLTPSEDSGGTGGGGGGYGSGPPRTLPRAASEEPALTRPPADHTPELLSPGPSVLVQSVSQDSGLEAGPPAAAVAAAAATARLGPGAPLSALTLGGTGVRAASSPGHCPVLRGGPALGCNFCWNSTDPQGRVLRRKTKYHCPECRTNLCIVPCFHEYHRQIERAQDADKQITKILTKTGSL